MLYSGGYGLEPKSSVPQTMIMMPMEYFTTLESWLCNAKVHSKGIATRAYFARIRFCRSGPDVCNEAALN